MIKQMLWRKSPSPALRERVAEGEARSRVRVFRLIASPSLSHAIAPNRPPLRVGLPPPKAGEGWGGGCAPGPTLSRNAGEGLCALLLALVVVLSPLHAKAALLETPMFTEEVAKGALPAIDERVPRAPALAELETLGRPGGDLRMLMSSPKDTRLMVVYGYSRLVAYTPALALVPDILEAADVEDDRVFTLRLRTGHKWSDGRPFTTEDFRYWFEDVAEDADLSPSGLPVAMLPNGERPKFEVLDARTVRFSWSRANPLFLPALAGPDPTYIYCPGHYLEQVPKKYADQKKLDELVKQIGARNWAALHSKMDVMYRNDNPDLPSLEPSVLRTKPPSQRLVF